MTEQQSTGVQRATECLDDEIDLRELWLFFWRGRWIILMAALVAAILAWGVSQHMPKQYRAQAIVEFRMEGVKWGASPQGQMVQWALPEIQVLQQLVQSPAVFRALAQDPAVQQAWAASVGEINGSVLAQRTTVTPLGSTSLELVVQDTDPQRAALLANHWAQEVIHQVEALYGPQSFTEKLDRQLAKQRTAYEQAETAYREALSATALEQQQLMLDQARQTYRCLLKQLSALDRLAEDIEGYRQYLTLLEPNAPLQMSDWAVLWRLQQRALAGDPCEAVVDPFQWQLPAEDTDALSVKDAQQRTANLLAMVQQKRATLAAQQEALAQQVIQQRREVEQANSQVTLLKQERDRRWAAYSRLLDWQDQLQQQAGIPLAQVVREAEIPGAPVSPKVKRNVLLGLMLGGLIGVLVAAWRESMRRARSS